VNTEKTFAKISADEVSGLLEGFGQTLRELMMNRSIYEIVAMWVIGLITVKVFADRIRSVLQCTDENAIRLEHAQTVETFGLLTENAEVFAAACKQTLIEMKEDLWKKGSMLLRTFFHWYEHDIETSRARCAIAVTEHNKMLAKSPWLGWLKVPVPVVRATSRR